MSKKPKITSFLLSQYIKILGITLPLIEKNLRGRISIFDSGCPSSSELKKVSGNSISLKNKITSISKRLQQVQKIVTAINRAIQATNVVITILKNLPVPNQVTTMGVTNLSSDLLRKLSTYVDETSEELDVISTISSKIAIYLAAINILFDLLDDKTQTCSIYNSTGDSEVLNRLSAVPETANDSENSRSLVENYKQYTIQIASDPNSPAIAPKRFAQVIDKRGVVVLKGPSSFSSSAQILIDEIKFRIDNNLP